MRTERVKFSEMCPQHFKDNLVVLETVYTVHDGQCRSELQHLGGFCLCIDT